MPLVVSTLKSALEGVFADGLSNNRSSSYVADAIATAVDAYIKTATVTVSVTTTGTATNQAGGGTGTLS